MAYVNVRDWSVDQVTDWLKGLDSIISQYTTSFLNNGVTGTQLLNLRADDLEHLGVWILGHQEVILEAVEHLRNFHFELDKENLQMLALRLSVTSNSLYRELINADDTSPIVQTQNMSDVHNIITTIKPLVCWLDRSPFVGVTDYTDCKIQLLQLSFEMATIAHRDSFSEKPVCFIRSICEKISKIADHIIQEISDPMILQPASLDLATLKKKEQELGFFILPHNHAIHQIAEIKYGSPAHGSTKIEEGDEIVQVNYQTVVGWQRKNVMLLLQDSPPEIVLTLKKRPRHTKVYGQIYMKPYRLPSKKRGEGQPYSRWNDSIPSPRLTPIQNLPPIKIPNRLPSVIEPPDVETESSSDSEPPDSPLDGSGRMYPVKPRPILQRRNTITGATPTSKRPYPSVEQYWQLWKNQAASTHSSSHNIDNAAFFDSNFLRDKSASCILELSPRPTTVIGGLSQNRNNLKTPSFQKDFSKNGNKSSSAKKKVVFQEKKDDHQQSEPTELLSPTNLNEEKSVSVNSLASLTNENIAFIDEGRELTDRTSMVTETIADDKIPSKDSVLAEVNIHDIIKKFDEQKQGLKPKVFPRSQIKKPPDVPRKPDKPAVPPRSATTKLRGRLDKSHSTPAYDLTGEETVVVTTEKPDGVTEIVKTEIKVQLAEPFSEKNYELGIPIVENRKESVTSDYATITATTTIEETKIIPIIVEKPTPPLPAEAVEESDLPPKPPPRTFGIVDVAKPAYPIDSPKPNLTTKDKPDLIKQVFEFPPETEKCGNLTKVYGTMEPSSKASKHGFEPKMTSTPSKTFGESDLKMPSFEIQKSTSESKISPTNSIVRAMIYKNKTGKKKTTITAKRRRVCVADLSPADIQGFLYQRLRSKHNQSVHWEKRWFMLLGSCLYGFKTRDEPRAACLIFLSGFTVAVANEVKSRSNAFKVYHTGTVFYFSAEDPEILQSWIEMITAATLHSDSAASKGNDSALYSETDDSDSEKLRPSAATLPAPEKNSESLKKFGSLKKGFGAKKNGDHAHASGGPGGSTSLDRKWFFNKSSGHSKNSLPVPTPQFRSYRKIRTDMTSSVTTGNFTSHVAFFAPRSEIPKLQHQSQNVSVPNLTQVEPVLGSVVGGGIHNNSCGSGDDGGNGCGSPKNTMESKESKLAKHKPLNYIHASNPSLCNITDFNVPSFTKNRSTFKHHDNLAGFVTLEELMIKQSEERKLNPYNMDEDLTFNLNLIKPDVVYGEVPIRPKEKTEPEPEPMAAPPTPTKKGHSRTASDSHKSSDKQDSSGSSCFGKRLGSLKKSHSSKNHNEFDDVVDDDNTKTATYPKTTKGFDEKLNRSLPRTHRVPENPSHYSSDRNLAFHERSYEMIYCPETTNDVHFAQNRQLDDRMFKEKKSKIKKKDSFKEEKKSPKYTNRVGDSSASKVRLKSATQYTPMALPLVGHDQKNRPKLAFELNLDGGEKGGGGGGGSGKGGKFKQIFGKQSEVKREKTLLGSPKLHRAIFGKAAAATSGNTTEVYWPSSPSQTALSQSTFSLENTSTSNDFSMNILSPHADYPGLEYPPVFEPETYSLADPQSSLTLLRKQQGKN